MSRTTEIRTSSLCYDFPIDNDIDPLNKEKRMTYYRVVRDMLLKLASSDRSWIDLEDETGSNKRRFAAYFWNTFDLTSDY